VRRTERAVNGTRLVTPEVRAALLRALRDRVGSAYLFPAPGNPEKPVTKDIAQKWLREAEAGAGMPHVARQGYHIACVGLGQPPASIFRTLKMLRRGAGSR
jgi:hypothetical protein